jgi:hypothetical protein
MERAIQTHMQQGVYAQRDVLQPGRRGESKDSVQRSAKKPLNQKLQIGILVFKYLNT